MAAEAAGVAPAAGAGASPAGGLSASGALIADASWNTFQKYNQVLALNSG